jgi:isopentenyl-diphosphate delta-isomerase
MNENNQIVSFDDEKLILVDDDDNIIGYKTKEESHKGNGILHRAFSIFIFDDQSRLLIHKRSNSKKLWPLYWSNSCCSHPRKGENIEEAAHRRLKEELGIETPLKILFKFQYSASYKEVGSEKEMCSVLIGKSNSHISANKNEIDEWKFADIDELNNDMNSNPDKYTPWFKLEWERIRKEYWQEIESLFPL